ncbi:unnamed protein product [Rhizopus microsporus]
MLPETNDDEQLAPRSVDISRWKRGTYRLNKESVGFKIDDLFIGVDPNFRDLVTAVDVSHEHIINKQTTKGHTFSISNGDYRVRSGLAWATQVELNRRCQYGSDGIQKWYDLIPSPNVTGCSGILSYVQIISISHVHIFTFMKGFEHRERKGYLYSNRQQTLDHITNALCGRILPNEPYRLCHSSTSRRRKKREKAIS